MPSICKLIKDKAMKLRDFLLIITALGIVFMAEAQSNNSFADERLSLSGYLQGGVKWETNDDHEQSSFYLKRARISLTGNAPEHKIDYRLQVDMANGPKICDLYFRYKSSDALNFQLGQFKLPFAIENDIYGPTKFEFIDYSYITTLFVRNNDRYDGIKATGRDLGLQVYGALGKADGYHTLSYNVGIFNGAGINTEDNNNAKDLLARIIYKPSKEISLTASYMHAESNHNSVVYMQAPRWSIGGIYDNNSVIVRSEFAQAAFGDRYVQAFYAMGGYKFEGPWAVYGRYEFLDHDSSVDEILNQKRITLGGVYKPYDFLRIQFNYTHTMNINYKNNSGLNFMVTTIF